MAPLASSEVSGALCAGRTVHFLPNGRPLRLALALAGGLLLAGCADLPTAPSRNGSPELAGARPIGGTGSSTAPKPIGGTGSSTAPIGGTGSSTR